MKKLKIQTVRELVEYARRNELDNVVGVLVRLNPEQLAECKALVWLGKGRDTPRHWEALVIEAKSKLDKETARLLAEEGSLAQDLERGLERMEDAGRI